MENTANNQYVPGKEINLDKQEDVNFWTSKFGIPAEGLTSAIKAAGSNIAETVEEWFSKNKSSK
ncbi:MAG: hypothetical protein JWQ96_652 [Segetibacter sp.]|nr:hypothetical protein [Segetibacter sp.]